MPRFSEIVSQKFPFEPTEGQRGAFLKLEQLLDAHDVLILKGYAGTGKTTLVSAVVQVLPLFNWKYSLLAPTGRAAKVMSGYAGRLALTIHKKIYKQTRADEAEPTFKKQRNYAKNTVFIVDEASMISTGAGFGKNGLLADLISFVFAESTNKLILIGDNAQLPPVGETDSPALDKDRVAAEFDLSVIQCELADVVRQEKASGILFNATRLRQELVKNEQAVRLSSQFADVFKMTGERLEDGIRYGFDNYGVENTTIICRSNKSANGYNRYIRNQIFFYESELEAGEYLMIVRNNYLFGPEEATFLANGDFVEVLKIRSFEESHGFRFATLELKLTDYPDLRSFEAKVMLDTLHSESPALTREQNEQLYQSVYRDYADMKLRERKEAIKSDPYLNALQIKFAYAITCHKAQGGQWPVVFVDQGYLKEDGVNIDFVRWLYTAVTRATEQLFFVNFNRKFFVKGTELD